MSIPSSDCPVAAIHQIAPLEAAIESIHKKFAAAIDSDNKARKYRIEAGKELLQLRARIEAGEAGVGVQWWQWYESKFVRSRRDAERVMALARDADPDAALERERERNREHQRSSRAARAATDVSRSKEPSEDKEIISPSRNGEESGNLAEMPDEDAHLDYAGTYTTVDYTKPARGPDCGGAGVIAAQSWTVVAIAEDGKRYGNGAHQLEVARTAHAASAGIKRGGRITGK
jgi:hypothetical protein